MKYYITNKRLIIFDSARQKVRHSFSYESFPEIHLEENAYNSGYIIIGEKQPVLTNTNLRWRVNMADHKIVLENIPEVRKTCNAIRNKIEAANEKAVRP